MALPMNEQAQRLAPYFTTPGPGDAAPDPAALGDPSLFDGLGLVVVRLQAGDAPATLWPHVPDALRAAVAALDPSRSAHVYHTWADHAAILGATKWDWQDYIPQGTLVMIAGAQESGKSTVALRIVATYTMGWLWPDATPYTGKTGSVVWAEGEAGQRFNTDRARAWELDLSRIIGPDDDLGDFTFEQDEKREAFWELMARPTVKLGIIDSLSGIHGGKESDAEMQRIIKPFAELARNVNKPIILTHHLNKPLRGQTDVLTLARVRGSGTITQTARVVWGIDTPDPELPETRRLQILKSNLGLKADPLGFTIGDKGVAWCDAPREKRKESQVDKAADMLLAWLAREPVPQTTLQQKATTAAISKRTLDRAKQRLRIVSIKRPEGWLWSLPSKEEDSGE